MPSRVPTKAHRSVTSPVKILPHPASVGASRCKAQHAIGKRLLREYAERIGLEPSSNHIVSDTGAP
jgi:hypothetical protein